jgi:ribonuclease HII
MQPGHEEAPQSECAGHQGYCTPEHQAALDEYGPCPQHRRRFENVRRSMRPDMGQNVSSPTGAESR